MNAPISALYQSGQNLYSVSISQVTGYFFNTVTPAYEVYASGHWSQYATALVEFTSSGIYQAAYPISSPSQLSTEVIFVRAGGSPALGDQPLLSYQSQGVNVATALNSWTSGQNFGTAVSTQQIGAISGTPSSSTALPTNLVSTKVDAYAGRSIIMTSGLLIQQAAYILSYDGAGNLVINGFPSAATPASSDTFIIV